MVAELFAGIPMAFWAPLVGIAPGDSTPTLTFTATGLPGIATAWYHGDSLPTLGVDPTNGDLFHDESKAVVTVGVDVAPTSLAMLALRLKTLTDSSCALNWITNSTLCRTLSRDLAASPSRVHGYSATLDSARRTGSAVADPAYFMLRANTDYALAFIDIPALEFTYVCRATFRVRNYSYAGFSVTVTGSAYGTGSGAGKSIPARSTDSPGYADLTIPGTDSGSQTYPYTLSLHYGGAVIKTATASSFVSC